MRDGTSWAGKISMRWSRSCSSSTEASARSTTAAATSSPKVTCGTANESDSRTAGWRFKASSIRRGCTFMPPRLIISLNRPLNVRWPSSSNHPSSPVRNQDCPRASRCHPLCAASSYPRVTQAPRIATSPTSDGGQGSPAALNTVTSGPAGTPTVPGRRGTPLFGSRVLHTCEDASVIPYTSMTGTRNRASSRSRSEDASGIVTERRNRRSQASGVFPDRFTSSAKASNSVGDAENHVGRRLVNCVTSSFTARSRQQMTLPPASKGASSVATIP